MIEEFIKSNFDSVIQMQTDIDHDFEIIEAIKNKSLNTDMVKS